MVAIVPKPKALIMFIPEEIIIGSHRFPTLLIFVGLSLSYWVFIIWYEGRKDGFDSERMLDLAFASIITASLIYFLYSLLFRQVSTYNPNSLLLKFDYQLTSSLLTFLGSLIPLQVFSKRWNWSRYRLLDIYSIASALFIFLFGLGRFLIYLDYTFLGLSLLTFAIYLQVLRFRGYKFSSGVIFSLFLAFLGVFGLLFLRKSGYLLIYGFLFILSIVNLIYRRKKSVYTRNLPAEFINALKSKLLAKDKSLKDSQQLLVKEDPYLQEGRANDNAEEMDEAILEDYQKNVNDAGKNIVKRLRTQVKKALAAIRLGKYGTCEICGSAIDKARLQAYPEATTCIECSSKASQLSNE